MSYNEILWWRSFSMIQPLEGEFNDYNTAKIAISLRGGSIKDAMLDGFNLENDKEWCEQRDKETKKRLAKKQKAHTEKLAKAAAEKERLENGTPN